MENKQMQEYLYVSNVSKHSWDPYRAKAYKCG